MTLVARIAFLVLVAATFAAFFVAQRLKSAPPVIALTSLNRAFSPARHPQQFSVTLKVDDDVTVDVVTRDGDRVRRLADGVRAIAHRPLRLTWDGRTDDGGRAPDGQYRIRVSLRNEGRLFGCITTSNEHRFRPGFSGRRQVFRKLMNVGRNRRVSYFENFRSAPVISFDLERLRPRIPL